MDNYSTKDSFIPEEGKSNGSSLTYGQSQSDVYDWLSDIVMPPDYKVCNIIEIKFKGSRKEFYLNLKNIYFKSGELVVVEVNTGGHDVGHVSLTGKLVSMQLKKKNVRTEDVIKRIYRREFFHLYYLYTFFLYIKLTISGYFEEHELKLVKYLSHNLLLFFC